MDAYTAADLLGLKGNNKEYRNKLFACMLTSSPTYLKEVNYNQNLTFEPF